MDWVKSGAEYQQHWSYIAPTRPALPAVPDSVQPTLAEWPKNPIDDFVLGKLVDSGLRPAAEADRRTLALERLGVVDKFRSFAPAVDPADPKGAKQLEEWAKSNPELLQPVSRGTTSTALDAIKAGASTALQQVMAGTRKSTLVTARNLAKLQ